MPCKPTRFPNGLEVGGCLHLVEGATIVIAEVAVEVTAAQSPYTMNGSEDVIYCTGECEIIMPSIATASKTFTVNADGGVVTMTPQGSDSVQNGSIVSPNSFRFGAKVSTSEWRLI
jgi:hypothetical protein